MQAMLPRVFPFSQFNYTTVTDTCENDSKYSWQARISPTVDWCEGEVISGGGGVHQAGYCLYFARYKYAYKSTITLVNEYVEHYDLSFYCSHYRKRLPNKAE